MIVLSATYELNLYKTQVNVGLQRDNTHRSENTKFMKCCNVSQGLSRNSSVMAKVTKMFPYARLHTDENSTLNNRVNAVLLLNKYDKTSARMEFSVPTCRLYDFRPDFLVVIYHHH